MPINQRAVLIAYTEDQNCPSKPHPILVDVTEGAMTDDEKQGVRDLINRYVIELEDDCVLSFDEKPSEYGDVTIDVGIDGLHVYLTFVNA